MSDNNKNNDQDFSDEFLPNRHKFIMFQIVTGAIWIIFIILSNLKIDFIGKLIYIPIGISLILALYSFLRVRCPKCFKPLANYGMSRIFVGKKCPFCGSILKKKGFNYPIHPWIPWSEKLVSEKIIISIIVSVGLMLIVFALFKGIKIET